MIQTLTKTEQIVEAAKVLREANRTIANDFGITAENAPSNPAFISAERLEKQIKEGLALFAYIKDKRIVGVIGIEDSGRDETVCYIERLAVLPQERHNGIGEKLMTYCESVIRQRRRNKAGIAIIEENIRLKKWYKKLGNTEKGTKKFDHLPFTVGFLEKEIKS